MEVVLIATIGPAIGLLGTVIGIHFGQRRERQKRVQALADRALEKHAEGSMEYSARQRAAYAELWDLVEGSQLLMRKSLDRLDPGTLAGRVTVVNQFLMRNAPWIDEDDGDRCLEYLYLNYQFLFVVGRHPVSKAWVLTTAALPDDLPDDLAQMKNLEAAALEVREDLLLKIRRVLGDESGTHIGAIDGSLRRLLDSEFQALVHGRKPRFRPLSRKRM